MGDTNSPTLFLSHFPISTLSKLGFPSFLSSDLVAYTAELQQIFQTDSQTLILGARYQAGNLTDNSHVLDSRQLVFPGLTPTPFSESVSPDLQRITGYGYYSYQVAKPLILTAGLSYDYLEYPDNDEISPIVATQDYKSQFSPKAGFRWTPLEHSTVRGAYTRSLGGVFYDTSVRLEPTEIAGFNQAFRSILPESVAGLVPGSRFETFDLAFDQELPTRTYFSVVGEILKSSGERGVGFLNNLGPANTVPGQFGERLDYRDKSLSVIVNQLLGDDFAVGASYKLDYATVGDTIPGIPAGQSASFSPTANRTVKGILHQVNVYALYNLPCGFFTKVEGVWSAQSNQNYATDLPGDDFVQVNAYAGFRLPRRLAEFQVGVLNIGDRDYQLNPLNLYTELPRERTFFTELKFNF